MVKNYSPSFYRKALGQHFLHSRRIADALVNALNPKKDDTVVEIGAGKGVITKLLARKAKKVVAIEIDENLILELKKLEEEYPNIELVHGDVLKWQLSFYPGCLLFGNLPYKISGPFIFWLIKQRANFKRGVFTFQKEFAERLYAPPKTSSYSALSVINQTFFKEKPILTIPPFHFYPRPKVDSQTVEIIPKNINLPVEDEKFIEIVKKCFKFRRKTLENNLIKSLGLPRNKMDSIKFDLKCRPQHLAPEDYVELVCTISNII